MAVTMLRCEEDTEERSETRGGYPSLVLAGQEPELPSKSSRDTWINSGDRVLSRLEEEEPAQCFKSRDEKEPHVSGYSQQSTMDGSDHVEVSDTGRLQ